LNQTKTSAFTQLGLASTFDRELIAANYHEPSKIQAQAIPVLLDGSDVLGIAQTGTGKTAAFGLPLLQRLHEENSPAQSRHPRGLVLAPTRELAIQIVKELTYFSRNTQLKLTAIYGGVGQNPQVKALRQGVDILVATPGRLLDLIEQKHLKLSHVSMMVLDEADRLLDMGFIRDVKRIVAMTPNTRQSLLFSATLPNEVKTLAAEMLKDPKKIDIAPKQLTVEKIQQNAVIIGNENKKAALEHILTNTSVVKAIVFARTKYGADKIAKQLCKSGITAEAIHGNKSQNARVRSLESFKKGKCWVLVATDVASRGIDIEGVTHVINYELPHEPESYIHRIGRTGRAGADGIAWSLVDPNERKRLKAIERLIGQSVPLVQLDLPNIVSTVTEERPKTENNKSNERSGSSKHRGRRNPQGRSKPSSGNSSGYSSGNRSGNSSGSSSGTTTGYSSEHSSRAHSGRGSSTESSADDNQESQNDSQRQPKRRRTKRRAA
jgi:ATP-dependent RNA helicase RhlE